MDWKAILIKLLYYYIPQKCEDVFESLCCVVEFLVLLSVDGSAFPMRTECSKEKKI